MKILNFLKPEKPADPNARSVPFRNLPEKVKENVIVYLRHCMFEVYSVRAFNQHYANLLNELNPMVIFFVDEEGKKFKIDDSDERLGRALGEALAAAAKHDDRIFDNVIIKMVERNDGAERLKMK